MRELGRRVYLDVWENGPTTAAEIAVRLGVTAPRATNAANRLWLRFALARGPGPKRPGVRGPTPKVYTLAAPERTARRKK